MPSHLRGVVGGPVSSNSEAMHFSANQACMSVNGKEVRRGMSLLEVVYTLGRTPITIRLNDRLMLMYVMYHYQGGAVVVYFTNNRVDYTVYLGPY